MYRHAHVLNVPVSFAVLLRCWRLPVVARLWCAVLRARNPVAVSAVEPLHVVDRGRDDRAVDDHVVGDRVADEGADVHFRAVVAHVADVVVVLLGPRRVASTSAGRRRRHHVRAQNRRGRCQ